MVFTMITLWYQCITLNCLTISLHNLRAILEAAILSIPANSVATFSMSSVEEGHSPGKEIGQY
jgi:hypothetical protein